MRINKLQFIAASILISSLFTFFIMDQTKQTTQLQEQKPMYDVGSVKIVPCKTAPTKFVWKIGISDNAKKTLQREYSVSCFLQKHVSTCEFQSWFSFVRAPMRKYSNKHCMLLKRRGHNLFHEHWSVTLHKSTCPPSKQLIILNYFALAVRMIRDVHKAGIVHNDLKPENFCVGQFEREQLHLIDFGMASSTQHEQFKILTGAGTCDFLPTYMLEQLVESQRQNKRNYLTSSPIFLDDLESLVYTFVEVMSGDLPWSNIDQNAYGKQLLFRQQLKPEELCQHCSSCMLPILKKIQQYLQNIKIFEDRQHHNIFDPKIYEFMLDQITKNKTELNNGLEKLE